MEKYLTVQNIILYIITVNGIGYLSMSIDKEKSR